MNTMEPIATGALQAAVPTATTDRYRPPYERYVVTVPRQCVFAGSVNPDTYLRDETGNRRFWPLRCGDIDLDALRRDRDQLWAEAVARFNAGEPWWLENRDLVEQAGVVQEARYQPDAWDPLIERWLTHEKRYVNVGSREFENWEHQYVPRSAPLTDVSVGEILGEVINLEPAKWTRADQMRVAAFLKARKWERHYASGSVARGVAREWRYRKPAETNP
jgi:putative DNA primase/helicase